MNTKKLTFNSIAVAAVTGCIITLAPVNAAQAADAQTTSQTSSPASGEGDVSAEIYAKAATVVSVEAAAKAVAVAGIDVTARTLLEEERTRSPHAVLRNLKSPTEAQVRQFGTVVHSMEQGQRILAQEVKAYNAKVNAARIKVAKLKIRIRHADSRTERMRLKRQLVRAERYLNRLRTSWQFIPLIIMAEGTCYLNSGRHNNLDLQPFTDCVDGDKKYVVAGWVPQLNEAVIVSIKYDNGRYVTGCINFMGFDIPEGTPPRDLFLVVRSLLAVEATVSGEYTEVVDLTVGGRLTCPDGSIVEDEITKRVQKTEHFFKTVKGRSVEELIRFGEEKAELDDELRATVRARIMDSFTQSVGASLTLECPNQKPGVGIREEKHAFVGGVLKITNFASDAENGSNVSLTTSVTGGAVEIIGDPRYPRTDYTEGDQKYVTYYVRVTGAAGTSFTVGAKATDQDGDSSTTTMTVPIVADQF